MDIVRNIARMVEIVKMVDRIRYRTEHKSAGLGLFSLELKLNEQKFIEHPVILHYIRKDVDATEDDPTVCHLRRTILTVPLHSAGITFHTIGRNTCASGNIRIIAAESTNEFLLQV